MNMLRYLLHSPATSGSADVSSVVCVSTLSKVLSVLIVVDGTKTCLFNACSAASRSSASTLFTVEVKDVELAGCSAEVDLRNFNYY